MDGGDRHERVPRRDVDVERRVGCDDHRLDAARHEDAHVRKDVRHRAYERAVQPIGLQLQRNPLREDPARAEAALHVLVELGRVEAGRAVGFRGRRLERHHVERLGPRLQKVATVFDDRMHAAIEEHVVVALAKERREVEDVAVDVHDRERLEARVGRERSGRRPRAEADLEGPGCGRVEEHREVSERPHVPSAGRVGRGVRHRAERQLLVREVRLAVLAAVVRRRGANGRAIDPVHDRCAVAPLANCEDLRPPRPVDERAAYEVGRRHEPDGGHEHHRPEDASTPAAVARSPLPREGRSPVHGHGDSKVQREREGEPCLRSEPGDEPEPGRERCERPPDGVRSREDADVTADAREACSAEPHDERVRGAAEDRGDEDDDRDEERLLRHRAVVPDDRLDVAEDPAAVSEEHHRAEAGQREPALQICEELPRPRVPSEAPREEKASRDEAEEKRHEQEGECVGRRVDERPEHAKPQHLACDRCAPCDERDRGERVGAGAVAVTERADRVLRLDGSGDLGRRGAMRDRDSLPDERCGADDGVDGDGAERGPKDPDASDPHESGEPTAERGAERVDRVEQGKRPPDVGDFFRHESRERGGRGPHRDRRRKEQRERHGHAHPLVARQRSR